MARSRVMIAVCAGALALAACSSSGPGSSGSTGSSGESGADQSVTMTALQVGTSPSVSNVSLYLAGESGGSLAKHNLSMTPMVVTSGAQAVPLLLNGQLQFTAADPLGAMVAIQNGTPIVLVASGNVAGADAEHDNTGFLASPDSGITSDGASFEGKTVAVNVLGSLAFISAKAEIDGAGGDSSKVKFVEIPIPQQAEAVSNGTVDATLTAEPFLTAGLDAGLDKPLAGLSLVLPGVPQVVYITSQQYAQEHPDVVRAFADSITEANQQLIDNPTEIKRIAATSTATDPATLDKIVLPAFDPPTIQIDILNQLQDLMVKYGVLDKAFDPTPHVFSG